MRVTSKIAMVVLAGKIIELNGCPLPCLFYPGGYKVVFCPSYKLVISSLTIDISPTKTRVIGVM
jgi:hypothetical protein